MNKPIQRCRESPLLIVVSTEAVCGAPSLKLLNHFRTCVNDSNSIILFTSENPILNILSNVIGFSCYPYFFQCGRRKQYEFAFLLESYAVPGRGGNKGFEWLMHAMCFDAFHYLWRVGEQYCDTLL